MFTTTAIPGKVEKGKLKLKADASLFPDGTEVILLPLDYWNYIAGSDSTRHQLEQAKEQIAEIRREPGRAREILERKEGGASEIRS